MKYVATDDDKHREELRNIEIEKLTPIDALNKLAELKKELDENLVNF